MEEGCSEAKLGSLGKPGTTKKSGPKKPCKQRLNAHSTRLDKPTLAQGGAASPGMRKGPQAGQQGAPHMHVLVCICSNVQQFS